VAQVAGIDVLKDPSAVRARIGLVFQDPSLDGQLTGRENLDFHAYLYGLPASTRKQRIDDALSIVELTDRADSTVLTYSGGMRRRLEIARGILHYPQCCSSTSRPWASIPRRATRSGTTPAVRIREHITIFMTRTTWTRPSSVTGSRSSIRQDRRSRTPSELKTRVGGDVVTITTPDTRRVRRDSQVMHLEPTQSTAPFSSRSGFRLLHAASLLRVERADHRGERPPSEPDDVFLKLTGRAIREQGNTSLDTMRNMGRYGELAPMSEQVLTVPTVPQARAVNIRGATMRAIYIIWKRDLIRYWRDRMRVFASLAQPVLFLFVFGSGLSSSLRGSTGGFGGPDRHCSMCQFIFPGIVGMSVLFTSIFGAMSIVWIASSGSERVLVAPIHRSAVAIGKTLGGATQAMFQASSSLFWPRLSA